MVEKLIKPQLPDQIYDDDGRIAAANRRSGI